MHVRLIAAQRIEDVLCAVAQVDGRDVPLIITCVARAGRARVARMGGIQITDAVACRGQAERRRALFEKTLGRGHRRPARTLYLAAILDLMLVHVAVEAV